MALAFALALVPATAASAATPLAAEEKEKRNVPDILIGAVVVLVILAILYLLFRVVRKRVRG